MIDTDKEELLETIKDMVFQFAYRGHNANGLFLTAGGLSALEGAFGDLEWADPHYTPELECEHEGCHEEGTCGTPTKDGYKFLCGKHYREGE